MRFLDSSATSTATTPVPLKTTAPDRTQVRRQSTQYKSLFGVGDRVARFFLVHDTETGKNVPSEQKMYRMFTKYPEWLKNITNSHTMYQHFPI
jgi:hypothetical protein